MWTVQECALARQRVFQCEHKSIDGATWRGFTHSSKNHAKCCLSQTYFKGVEHDVPNIGNDLERICNFEVVLDPSERQKRSLLYIASLLKSQRCLHPSDKLYGLLGLAGGQPRITILPHYSHPLGALADFIVSDEDETFTSTLIIDSIANVGGSFNVAPLTTVLQECESLARLHDDWSLYIDKPEAFQRALCGGIRRLSFDVWGPVGAELPETYDTGRRWQISEPTATFGQSLDQVEKFKDAFCTARAGRRFTVTDTGYIGFVSTGSRHGDVIALMPGGKVTYALRSLVPAEGTNPTGKLPRYRFVGDAYIQGIMHGEAWSDTRLDTIVLV